MKTILVSLFFIFSCPTFSGDYDCVENLIDKKVIFAFNDGDVHQMVFVKNEFNIVTAKYEKYNGQTFYSNMEVYCLDYSNEIMIMKSKNSSGFHYKHPVHIEIPSEIVSGEDMAKIDLRWGVFYDPLPVIFLEKF